MNTRSVFNTRLLCVLFICSGLKFEFHYSKGVYKSISIFYKLPRIEVVNTPSFSDLDLENIGEY